MYWPTSLEQTNPRAYADAMQALVRAPVPPQNLTPAILAVDKEVFRSDLSEVRSEHRPSGSNVAVIR